MRSEMPQVGLQIFKPMSALTARTSSAPVPPSDRREQTSRPVSPPAGAVADSHFEYDNGPAILGRLVGRLKKLERANAASDLTRACARRLPEVTRAFETEDSELHFGISAWYEQRESSGRIDKIQLPIQIVNDIEMLSAALQHYIDFHASPDPDAGSDLEKARHTIETLNLLKQELATSEKAMDRLQ